MTRTTRRWRRAARPAVVGLLISALVLTAPAAIADEDDSDAGAPRVVFVVGESEYGSERSMPALADLLEGTYGFETTVLLDRELEGGPRNSIAGLEALAGADLVVLHLRFRQLPAAQLERISDYLASGARSSRSGRPLTRSPTRTTTLAPRAGTTSARSSSARRGYATTVTTPRRSRRS